MIFLAYFTGAHSFGGEATLGKGISIISLKFIKKIVEIFGDSWPLIFGDRSENLHSQFFINFFKYFLGSWPDILVLVGQAIDQTFGIISDIWLVDAFLMNYYQVQHFESSLFSSLQVLA